MAARKPRETKPAPEAAVETDAAIAAAEGLMAAEAEISAEGKAGRDVFPPGIRERYTKTRIGKTTHVDSDDQLAQLLRGQTVEAVAELAAKTLGEGTAGSWLAFYTTEREAEGKAALNPGMVRMNLGNRIRGAIGLKTGDPDEAALERFNEAAVGLND